MEPSLSSANQRWHRQRRSLPPELSPHEALRALTSPSAPRQAVDRLSAHPCQSTSMGSRGSVPQRSGLRFSSWGHLYSGAKCGTTVISPAALNELNVPDAVGG